jgi:hypothetical protein
LGAITFDIYPDKKLGKTQTAARTNTAGFVPARGQ